VNIIYFVVCGLSDTEIHTFGLFAPFLK